MHDRVKLSYEEISRIALNFIRVELDDIVDVSDNGRMDSALRISGIMDFLDDIDLYSKIHQE